MRGHNNSNAGNSSLRQASNLVPFPVMQSRKNVEKVMADKLREINAETNADQKEVIHKGRMFTMQKVVEEMQWENENYPQLQTSVEEERDLYLKTLAA